MTAPPATPSELALRPVFVLGCTYRTGTTFLQRLLISTREVFIWGENVGIAADLERIALKLDSWREISGSQERHFDAHDTGAWIANINPRGGEQVRQALRSFLLSYYAAASAERGFERWGYKEVRDSARTARFLLELFPHARCVLLVRHPREVLASMATCDWYPNVGGASGVMAAWTDNARGFLALDDARAAIFRLEDFASAPAASLARLGELTDIDPLAFDRGVLASVVRGSIRAPSIGTAECAALAGADRDLLHGLGYTR